MSLAKERKIGHSGWRWRQHLDVLAARSERMAKLLQKVVDRHGCIVTPDLEQFKQMVNEHNKEMEEWRIY